LKKFKRGEIMYEGLNQKGERLTLTNLTGPKIVVTPPGPKAKSMIERDSKTLSQSLTRTSPLVGVETDGVYVKDIDGNVYLDFGCGIAVTNVGHRHPKVIEAVKKQMDVCDHVNSCDYYTVPQIEYAEKLFPLIPIREEKRIFFANSGSEAIECAIKVAKWHSKRYYFIGFIGGFHGRTMGALSFTTTSTSARKYYDPLMPGVYHTPFAYCYRCYFKQTYPECGMWCLGFIEDVIMKKMVSPQEVAGVIAESVQGAGGYIVPPDEFLPGLKRICEKNEILYIDDEVQTGFGRTGKMWAIENWGVEPDIMCMSKAIANGLPMGACVTKAGVMDWEGNAHENTLGGNPIVVSAALAVLGIIKGEKLVENSAKVGKYAMKRMKELQDRYSIIGDVRGKGLMIGMELVKDRKTKAPATKERDEVVDEAFKRGLLLLGAGVCSLRLAPPLTLTEAQADTGIDIMEEVIKKVEK
jgi:4-aminobutyrate aminotransferase